MKLDILNGTILKLFGTELGTISYASKTLSQFTTTPDLVLKLWNEIRVASLEIRSMASYKFSNLVADLMYDGLQGCTGQESEEAVSDHAKVLQERSDWANQGPCFHPKHLQSWIALKTNAKRVIVVEGYRCGLALAMAQSGDVVARLYGSTSLAKGCVHLLRPTEKPSYYKLVGPAWINTMTAGGGGGGRGRHRAR